MVIGIVVTHGGLSHELLDTAAGICGECKGCHALSNVAKSSQAMVAELEKIVSQARDSNYVLFVDFFAGSCSYACLKFQRQHPEIPIISGINLPLFLAFMNKRDEVPFDRLIDELIRRGRESIKLVELN